MKSKQTIIAAILALSFAASVSGQEEFRFKLYLESLSNGKKDTLDLVFSEQGYRNTQCEYDSISGLDSCSDTVS